MKIVSRGWCALFGCGLCKRLPFWLACELLSLHYWSLAECEPLSRSRGHPSLVWARNGKHSSGLFSSLWNQGLSVQLQSSMRQDGCHVHWEWSIQDHHAGSMPSFFPSMFSCRGVFIIQRFLSVSFLCRQHSLACWVGVLWLKSLRARIRPCGWLCPEEGVLWGTAVLDPWPRHINEEKHRSTVNFFCNETSEHCFSQSNDGPGFKQEALWARIAPQ